MKSIGRHNFFRMVSFALVIILMFSTVGYATAAGTEIPESTFLSESYVYPVIPGTDEWKELQTHEEMLEVSQIPDDILCQMTTEALVQTVLDYPLSLDMLLFDTYKQGFKAVYGGFNGLRELVDRKDSGSELLKRYKAISVPRNILSDEGSKAYFDLAWLEIILAQQEIRDTMSLEALRLLDSEVKQKSNERISMPDIYGSLKTYYYYAMNENDTSRQITSDSKYMSLNYSGMNGVSTGRFTLCDYISSVNTPMGTSIPVEIRDAELPPPVIGLYDEEMDDEYPNATRLRSTTRLYNCHSYAWYNQSTSNNIWMSNPYNNSYNGYMNDGSYSSSSAAANRRIFYNATPTNGSHSGIVSSVSGGVIYVTSKWGECGLYYHSSTYCPYYYFDSDNRSYWS